MALITSVNYPSSLSIEYFSEELSWPLRFKKRITLALTRSVTQTSITHRPQVQREIDASTSQKRERVELSSKLQNKFQIFSINSFFKAAASKEDIVSVVHRHSLNTELKTKRQFLLSSQPVRPHREGNKFLVSAFLLH